MDTHSLITFVKAVELENFFQVAQSLGYAPSTVTVQIKNLETELGFPLFDRAGKKIKLTALGAEFLPYANKIIALNKEAHSLNSTEKDPQGLIRCGSIESYTSNVLVYHLSLLLKMYPGIKINLQVGNSEPLFKMLRQGEIDIIFCVCEEDAPLDKSFACLYERKEPLIFAASYRNKLAKKKNIKLETILKEPLILSEYSGRYRRILDSIAAKHNITLQPTLGLENVSAVSKLVANNLGVTFLPKYCLERDITKKLIVALDVDEKIAPLSFRIIYNKSRWVSPALKAFMKFIFKAETDHIDA